MKKQIKVKLNEPMKSFQKGATLSIDVDENGTPFNRFWRRRMKDAEFDNCLEVIEHTKPKMRKSK